MPRRHPAPGLVVFLPITVLVTALVTALSGGPGRAQSSPLVDFRLGDDAVPVSQAVDLTLDAGETEYRGSVRIELEVKRPIREIRFHSERQAIGRLVLAGAGGPVAVTHERVGDDLLAVSSEQDLAPGHYTLAIDFTNSFGTRAVGLYRMEQDGVGYAVSQFEADDAREAFPCWDEPRFKIPFRFTLTVPEGHLAVTNTPVEKETVEDGWRTTVFAETPPISTYILALATGPFETVEMPGLGLPGRIVTVRGQSHLAGTAVELTPPILKALETWFDRPYPYAKLDFLAVPEFWPGAMENPGAVTFADGILLTDPQAVTPSQRRRLARVIAHELAHMWFGDLVTLEWWDDLWLNESFADWIGDKITDQVFPQSDHHLASIDDGQDVMMMDARSTTEPVRRKVDSTADLLEGVGLAYDKGKTVLGMFEHWLGPEVFRTGVLDYIGKNAWGNAVADDLWKALDKASGKPVSRSLATFIEQPGFPRIDVELLEGGRVRLRQERFRNYGSTSDDYLWRVPVLLKYPVAGNADGEVPPVSRSARGDGPVGRGFTATTVVLDQAETLVQLEVETTPPWIFPNAEARGYYRWTLPGDRLRELASDAESMLNPAERIALVSNVESLLNAGLLDGGSFLATLESLGSDPEPMVVRSVMDALSTVEMAFVPEELEGAFASYVRRTLGAALERFGREARPGEKETVSLIRPQLLAWLGEEGRREDILDWARSGSRSYLEDPMSLDPSLAGVALRLTALNGDGRLFDTYRERFESARVPTDRSRFLDALGSFRKAEIRARALDYSLSGSVRPNEIVAVVSGVASDEAGQAQVFEHMTGNYKRLAERFPPEFMSLMPFLVGGCSMELLDRGRDFFGKPENQFPGTRRTLNRVAEQVTDCVHLRQREGEAVKTYLRE